MGFARPLVKLIIFGLVTVLATYLLISTITNQSFGDQTTYRAQFSDVTGLVKGDDVRIAGVRVGSVEGIAVVDRNLAEVTFTVQSSTSLPDGVQALVRYRNLVGRGTSRSAMERIRAGIHSPRTISSRSSGRHPHWT